MAVIGFTKQVTKSFGADKVGQLSAAFAYNAIFAIGPLLLVLVSIVGFAYGEQAAQGKLFGQLSGTLGADSAKTIQHVVAQTHKTGGGVLALVLGAIGMLFGAAGITSQLQNAFNTILGVVPDPKSGIKRTIYVKLKNSLLVIIAGLIVTASLVVSSMIAGIGHRLQVQTGLPPIILELVNNLVSLLVLSSLLYFIYRVIPDTTIPPKILAVTALCVTLLFVAGKIILGIVIGNNATAGAYGAAATLITLLLWIYYSGQILFAGAIGMKVYAFNNSLEYKPKKFNLKRTTVHIDGDDARSSLAEAWVRGFRKGSNR